MKQPIKFVLTTIILSFLISCVKHNHTSIVDMNDLSFPYQAYLDSMGEDEYSPTIGNDGNGFEAISHNIVYPEMPDTLSLSHYADSLLQFYNITLAFNTMGYDISTAERYLGERDFGLAQAEALDSINLSGIKLPVIKQLMSRICKKEADAIRRGEKPTELDIPETEQLFKVSNDFSTPLYNAHLDDSEFDPAELISNYKEIHSKALTDTASFRTELLEMVRTESDFQKQCVLARELAYANFRSPMRDDKQIVAVLDKILRANRYSPLLGELWRMWRCMLQINILGSRSNDGAMYNLFYNQMKNRIALVYIAHMKTHYHDRLAFKEFVRLAMAENIVRNSPCLFGNNANLEVFELFNSVFEPNE